MFNVITVVEYSNGTLLYDNIDRILKFKLLYRRLNIFQLLVSVANNFLTLTSDYRNDGYRYPNGRLTNRT